MTEASDGETSRYTLLKAGAFGAASFMLLFTLSTEAAAYFGGSAPVASVVGIIGTGVLFLALAEAGGLDG